ncbi:hypothetical protein EA114_20040 [Salmonella enterica subsp. enterica serovar 6,7:b:-]|nr:hypothetical protein [Salmonella enterica subsp. enterica serovar 6,7:b:-]EBH8908101.1 hypothetical protein [Salmonella enterica subsp. enterica serovar Santiago]EBH8944695.1 hypothetical protein [Salmonella enterica subsp. enterica serovar 6,7:b:-]EBH8968277.1 hypothetical protein [Salmonella enterica subsp. enterica serovar Santiago]MMQ68563.1 hypothetical protein [Salmonella enterica subsp. enterica serovar 6,7:b:-]
MHNTSLFTKIITAVIMITKAFLRFTENIMQAIMDRIRDIKKSMKASNESKQRITFYKSIFPEFLL